MARRVKKTDVKGQYVFVIVPVKIPKKKGGKK